MREFLLINNKAKGKHSTFVNKPVCYSLLETTSIESSTQQLLY